jgi:two-component system, chemotaxis family, protein-glutamate methylesterase/glutaminase
MVEPAGKKLRVVIVDDSSICRAALKDQLEADGDIEVVAEGEDAFSALALVDKLRPDLVTMDVQMPGKSGLEAVEQIMSCTPTPILVVTAESLSDDAGVAFKAIENGALDIVAKPAMTDEAAARAIRELVRQLATVPVFQRVADAGARTTPAVKGARVDLVVIGAGTGGMGSVLSLLTRVPTRLRCPIILYQPVANDLIASYTRYLETKSKQAVSLARPPEHSLAAGEVALVPGLRATFMNRMVLRVDRAKPSLEALLRSVAEVHGPRAAAVLLPGEDTTALDGMRAMRDAGGTTLIEATDSESDAVASGAVERACRVEEIADWLLVNAAF